MATLQETKESMIKSINWSINYHQEALDDYKNQLKVVNESKTIKRNIKLNQDKS